MIWMKRSNRKLVIVSLDNSAAFLGNANGVKRRIRRFDSLLFQTIIPVHFLPGKLLKFAEGFEKRQKFGFF
jgi:hypothetical protein